MKPWILAAAGTVGGLLLLLGLAGVAYVLISRLVDRRIDAYQSDLVQKHCVEVENIYRQMRGWRHDYHNHIQSMKALLSLGQMEDLDRYLGDLDTDLTTVDTVIKTGNVMVDAILNSKISLAQSKGISVNAKAVVPQKLSLSEVDLCVIIGNLLDNAMEACMKIEEPEKRFIRIYLGTLREQLYFSVSNAVGGKLQRQGKGYATTKGGSHGFGLRRVDAIVEKNMGYLNRQDEGDVFATEVMLPL